MKRTLDGKEVLDFFELYNTYGIPLDVILEEFVIAGFVPNWLDFWEKACMANWNPYTTLGKLKEAVAQVYEDDFYEQWLLRMRYFISQGIDK